MKLVYTQLLVAGVLLCGGCAAPYSGKKVGINPVETLIPDSASRINLDLEINIPEKSFTKRSRLIVVPQLVVNDSMVSECRPVVLDAPVFSKKMERKKKLSGYVDTLEANVKQVDNREMIVLPYKESVYVPEGMDGGKIIAVLSTDGCGECEVADTVEMAYVSNIPTLAEPIRLNWIEPEFVIRPKIVEGRGEALLQFDINKYDINLSLGNNKAEMNGMLEALQKIVSDSLATLNSVSIYGMASADGSYSFNDRLAKNRASSAKKWLVENLGLSSREASHFSVGARPEGWLPVLEAMKADGHKDTLLVKNIIEKYEGQNDDVAERYIRRLECWNDIKTKYLQKDRKVVYEYTYTLKSFTTDEEMLDMYGKRPDAFNEEELLRVSTLKQTTDEKEEVYRTILYYFPQSQVAANNLAVIMLGKGKVDEAEDIINSLDEYSPAVMNTKAAIYVYKNEYEKAVELLETEVELPEAKYNLGLVKALTRDLDEAYGLLKDYKDTNAAIVALSVNRNDEAEEIMEACEDFSPRAEYVRALVYARMNDADKMMTHLQKAATEERYKTRAKSEIDFIPYADREDFVKLVNGGEAL